MVICVFSVSAGHTGRLLGACTGAPPSLQGRAARLRVDANQSRWIVAPWRVAAAGSWTQGELGLLSLVAWNRNSSLSTMSCDGSEGTKKLGSHKEAWDWERKPEIGELER